MSYEPTVWKSGDVVTSAKLNKLEQGVAGGGSGGGKFVINATLTEDAQAQSGYAVEVDHTFAEIAEALENRMVCELWAKYNNNYYYAIYQMCSFVNHREDSVITTEVFFYNVVTFPSEIVVNLIGYDPLGWSYIAKSYTWNS